MNLTERATKFLSRNPTLIGVVGHVRFYEHPAYGDEHPLVQIDSRTGKVSVSDHWELPSLDEL